MKNNGCNYADAKGCQQYCSMVTDFEGLAARFYGQTACKKVYEKKKRYQSIEALGCLLNQNIAVGDKANRNGIYECRKDKHNFFHLNALEIVLPLMFFYIFEVSVGFLNNFEISKCIAVFGKNLMEII